MGDIADLRVSGGVTGVLTRQPTSAFPPLTPVSVNDAIYYGPPVNSHLGSRTAALAVYHRLPAAATHVWGS